MSERAAADPSPDGSPGEGQAREQDDAQFLARWDESLDALSYYAILGIGDGVTTDDVIDAFHRFCETFHPDLHGARSAAELRIVTRIFARGVEAYRVLLSPTDRGGYDASLANADVRPARFSSMRPPPGESATLKSAPPTVDTIAKAAQPHLEKAQAHALRGEYGAAKLHTELALIHDPKNENLKSLDGWLAQKVLRARE